MKFCAPCLFGVEGLVGEELRDLEFENVTVQNGRVLFEGDVSLIPRANICSRFAERILIVAGQFKAHSFDELFENVKKIKWSNLLPKNATFPVKGWSLNSALHSIPDCQKIIKKAIVNSLSKDYGINWFEENGESFPLRVFIHKDEVTVGLDTTGESLHKRGYRRLVGKAPISETLAAALIMLTPWREDRILVDPFCGSGTFPIEAAMIGANIAPGVNREFTSNTWEKLIDKKIWYEAYDEARSLEKLDVDMHIQGYDLDSQMVKCAMQNAEEAGVGDYIHFQARAVKDLSSPKSYGFIITNPPYGERLEEKERLLSALKAATCDVILVTNETGMGIVPDNALSRRFRDEAGFVNQAVAAIADNVVLMVCGLPMSVKGTL